MYLHLVITSKYLHLVKTLCIYIVFKGANGARLALKRMCVNNDKDLAVCKREINIVVSLNNILRLYNYLLKVNIHINN